jgi:CheY-like chemotaxis protein
MHTSEPLTTDPDPSVRDRQDGKPRLLLVEDGPSIVQLVRYILGQRTELVATGTYDDALRRLEADPYDLFLIDIQLGEDRTGIDLLREIRDRPLHRSTPAIALTAHALPGDRERLLEAGFDAYVSKPFARSELEEAVRTGLGGEAE